jgi:TetR/AcrR family transcriptional regulator, mexJK operon transcriptional repressor
MHVTAHTPRAQAKRDAILAAAHQLFIQHGFGDTSMDAIAAEASVSKQTLYRYYQNKEALFVATMQRLVFEQDVVALFVQLRQMPMESLPRLERALVTWAQLVLEHIMRPTYVALVRVLIAELPRFPTLGSLFFSAIPQEGSTVLRALLESAVDHGVVQVRDLDTAMYLFVSSLLMHLFGGLLRPDNNLQPLPPERVATHVRLFLQGVACRNQEETH